MALAHHLGTPAVFLSTPCDRRLECTTPASISSPHRPSCCYPSSDSTPDSRHTTTSICTPSRPLHPSMRVVRSARPGTPCGRSGAGGSACLHLRCADGAENESVDGKDAVVDGRKRNVGTHRGVALCYWRAAPLGSGARYTTTNTPGSIHSTDLDAFCIRERCEDPSCAASSDSASCPAATTNRNVATTTTAAPRAWLRRRSAPLPGDPRWEDNLAKAVTKLFQSRRDDALRIGAMTDGRAPRSRTAGELPFAPYRISDHLELHRHVDVHLYVPPRPSALLCRYQRLDSTLRARSAYLNGTAPYTQAAHPRFATYALTRLIARPRLPQPYTVEDCIPVYHCIETCHRGALSSHGTATSPSASPAPPSSPTRYTTEATPPASHEAYTTTATATTHGERKRIWGLYAAIRAVTTMLAEAVVQLREEDVWVWLDEMDWGVRRAYCLVCCVSTGRARDVESEIGGRRGTSSAGAREQRRGEHGAGLAPRLVLSTSSLSVGTTLEVRGVTGCGWAGGCGAETVKVGALFTRHFSFLLFSRAFALSCLTFVRHLLFHLLFSVLTASRIYGARYPRPPPRLRIRPHRSPHPPHLPSHPTCLLASSGHNHPSESTPRYGSVANARRPTPCTATQDPLPLSMSAFVYAAHDAHTWLVRVALLPSLVKWAVVECCCHCAAAAAVGGAATHSGRKLALAVVVTVAVTLVGEESVSLDGMGWGR
ncbi:hypothetical protein C8R45DRAFT_1221582 [Mycena sanguinolenta]|nr:hypothetical protein C8R45DRAFT_1221582 [Mycena sanguinolenta]